MAQRGQESENLVLALRKSLAARLEPNSPFFELSETLIETLPDANPVAPRWICWLLDQLLPFLRNESQRTANERVRELYWQWATTGAKPPNRDWTDAYNQAFRAEKEICLPAGGATNAAQLAALGRSQAAVRAATNTARIYPDTIANLALRDEDTEVQQQAAWERMSRRFILYLRTAQSPLNAQEQALQLGIFEGQSELIPIYCDWLEEHGDAASDYIRPLSEQIV